MDTEWKTDVLIVGAGPAGLMAGLWLSELGVSYRIIDHLGTRALNGRADGYQVRTIEIWDSFGIADKLEKKGNRFGEWALWTPDQAHTSQIKRQHKEMAMGDEVSRKSTHLFHQGWIEACLHGAMIERGGPKVSRGAEPMSLEVDKTKAEDMSAYPVKVSVKYLPKSELQPWRINAHTKLSDGSLQEERGSIDAFGDNLFDVEPTVSGKEGTVETIHAKYLIGTDGGRSWVRHNLPGFVMEGANRNSVWGVIDIVPITNFPDIRRFCTILSTHGTLLVLPRENGLVRLYIQLPDEQEDDPISALESNNQMLVEEMMAIARNILAPYALDYEYCDWWTVYRVGQRVCNHFSYLNRVFLAGDAVHTHTPKGGQGMNVSQQDAYNLAWKIAGVIRGQLKPEVLSTYESERRPVAQQLVDLDHDLSKVLSVRVQAPLDEVQAIYDRLRFQGSGANLCYGSGLLIAGESSVKVSAAQNLKLGMRLPDATVYDQSSSVAVSSQSLLVSDGRWRLLAFVNDLSQLADFDAVSKLGQQLTSLSEKYCPISSRRKYDIRNKSSKEQWLQVLLFHSSSIDDVEAPELHPVFRNDDRPHGYNHGNVFADKISYHETLNPAHQKYGIDKNHGALVLVRPDQMIAWMGKQGDVEMLEIWLDKFMLPSAA